MSIPQLNLTTSGLYQVPYGELVVGYSESWTAEGAPEVTRHLYCLWDDKRRFSQDMIGWSTLRGADGTGIRRRLPEPHPIYTGPTQRFPLYCVSCDLVAGAGVPQIDPNNTLRFADTVPGFLAPKAPGTSGLALFRVTYRALSYQLQTDEDIDKSQFVPQELGRYIERKKVYAAQNIEVTGNSFYYVNPASPRQFPVPTPLPKTFISQELHYTWYHVPTTYPGVLPGWLEWNFNQIIGCVNGTTENGTVPGGLSASGDFDALPVLLVEADPTTGMDIVSNGILRYPAQSLLCLAPQIENTREANLEPSLKITFRFLYREGVGHNKVWAKKPPGGGQPKFVLVTTTGNTGGPDDHTIYPPSDFAFLFTPNKRAPARLF